MERYLIAGGKRLVGAVRVDAAKNAVLPLLAASILADGIVRLEDCPRLLDVESMIEILRNLGCKAHWDGGGIIVDPAGLSQHVMPEAISKEIRSSIFLLGPILARLGRATVTYPGGCEIGQRPIDLHLAGLRALGANIREEDGFIYCEGALRGADIHMDYPSVGATENVMMAAVLAQGHTVIHNAAQEPEVADLAAMINRMGGKVCGAGSATVAIEGVCRLSGCAYAPMFDRIVAGTLLAAGAVTGGDVMVRGANAASMRAVLFKIEEMGCTVSAEQDGIRLCAPGKLRALRMLETGPHPGFPTDMQAQMLAAATVAQGVSVVVERVFENRYGHVHELRRMGADITVRDRTAIVCGQGALHAASVTARDLRGGAALVIAGLAARGVTEIGGLRLIDRGYDGLERMIGALGGDIRRIGAA